MKNWNMERKVKFPANIHYCLCLAIYWTILASLEAVISWNLSDGAREIEEREDKPINNFTRKKFSHSIAHIYVFNHGDRTRRA